MAGKKGSFYGVIALAALFVAVAPRAARAQIGQWTSNVSGGFGSVTVDPSDPWRLYTLSWSGALFTSEDAGVNWSQMDLPFDWSAVAVSRSRLGTLYAFDTGSRATHPRLFRSSDNGVGWSPTAFQVVDADYPRTVAIDPRTVSTVYAGTYRGLSRSTDGGATWGNLKLRETETRQIYDILFPPRDPSTVYVLDADYSYYPNFAVDKTTDGGRTWKTVVTGPGLLVMDPFDPSILYGAGCPYAYRSTDGGETWTTFDSPSISTCNFGALVADPVRRGHFYAGLYRGEVMRSRDGGNTWERLGVGNLGYITRLAIDPAGLFLHASASEGVFNLQLGETQASPCERGPERLCLLGGRFEVSAKYGDSAAEAVPQGDLFGSFQRPGTGPAGPEIFVKLADGRAFPNRAFWFFHASVADLAYTITVRDTSTGRVRFYRNEPSNPGCGAADTAAFVERSASPASEDLRAGSSLSPGDGETLSLMGGRFQATLSVLNPFTGTTDSGRAMPQTDGLGYFSFPSVTGDPAFPEVFVSIFEPRPFERTFAHTGLTNLQYTLTITDQETGLARIHQNDGNDVFNLCGGLETVAFE
jgi:photosystem II stability/assembly factor-like uncharacterized protein